LDCKPGKYIGLVGQYECLDCARGTHSGNSSAVYCIDCKYGYSSASGAASCDEADKNFYINKHGETMSCPAHTKCSGGVFAPIPDAGYWADRSNYKYAGHSYKCSRDTCIGPGVNSTCWHVEHYTDNSKHCDSSYLQCAQGAIGVLCGSCDIGYVYQQTLNSCVSCKDSSNLYVVSIIFAVLFAIVVVLLVTYYFEYHGCNMFNFLLNMERGSLKVNTYFVYCMCVLI
jgi:hypothetical protein